MKELFAILFYGFCGFFAGIASFVASALMLSCAMLGFCGIWLDKPEWATAFFLGTIVCYLFDKQFSKSMDVFSKKLDAVGITIKEEKGEH
jgi:hypothetical protein